MLGACGAESPHPATRLDPRIAQLERWVAFHHADGSLFFLSRFETREADVLAVRPEAELSIAMPDLPAGSLDLRDAMRIARAYWGRLPSLAEWRSAVAGPSGYRFPWGEDDGNRLRANTPRLGLWRRTRVGTFESGRDLGRADSCYDLFGNIAEWTLEPHARVDIDRLATAAADLDERFEALKEILPPPLGPGVPVPWDPATPFLPELVPYVSQASPVTATSFCVVGFSYAQHPPERHVDTFYGEQIGVRALQADETESDVGMRMATDPYTMLAALERAGGQPLPGDREALGRFLLRHVEPFRSAARTRLRLDRAFLGLSEPGPWARSAYATLGVR